MMNRGTRLARVVVACLISGLSAGLLAAAQCQDALSDCRIAALAAFAPEPVPWTLWLHWINWLPGIVFGLLFALAAQRWAPYYGRRAAMYAMASGLIYVAAGLVFSVFMNVAGSDEYALLVWIWPAGLFAGLVGGLLLTVAADRVLGSSDPARGPLHGAPLPAALGAILGILFVLICSYGEQRIFLAFPAAFAIWQVGVGLALRPMSASARPALL